LPRGDLRDFVAQNFLFAPFAQKRFGVSFKCDAGKFLRFYL